MVFFLILNNSRWQDRNPIDATAAPEVLGSRSQSVLQVTLLLKFFKSHGAKEGKEASSSLPGWELQLVQAPPLSSHQIKKSVDVKITGAQSND